MKNSFSTIFNRITFITRLLMNDDTLTLEDIDRKWQDNSLFDETPITRKVLERDRKLIYKIFGLNIESVKLEANVYVYNITNKERIRGNSVFKWTMETLSTAEIFAEYVSLKDRISLENFYPDMNFLPEILEAMFNEKKLIITYKKFTDEIITTHSAEPYFLKSYQHRLYIVARVKRDNKYKPCVFSLDRILDLEITSQKFKMPVALTVDEFFYDCYGVFNDEEINTQRITLRAHDDEMYYLKSRPLHHSQMAITLFPKEEKHCDFQVFLKPTKDFIGYIISRAGRIEVLEPKELRKTVGSALKKAIKLYDGMDGFS